MTAALSTFTIKPDHIDAFVAAMVENQNDVRAEPGNIEMKLFQSAKTPGNFFVFGRSADQAAQEAHVEQSEKRGIAAKVAPALAKAPVTMPLIATTPAPEAVRKTAAPEDDEQVLFFIFNIKESYRDRVIAQFENHVTESRKEAGCLVFDFYAVEGQSDTFVVYERWRSAAAIWEKHMNSPHGMETGALLQEAVIGDVAELIVPVTEIIEV